MEPSRACGRWSAEVIRGEPTALFALDGYTLGARRFAATPPLRGRIVVAGATGVRQSFYARFAEYAASRGFDTLTLDYRGIGESKPASLVGFEASLLDWARLDLAAAVEARADDEVPLFIVAHSFGGHALGLIENHHRISGCYIFAAAAGWHGWMPPIQRLRILLLWNVVLPPLVRWRGYLPASLLKMGEDMPLGVYRQWRRWCQFPHYFLDDPESPELRAQCARVRVPIVAATALDDTWAPPSSRDAFVLSAYTSAPIERLEIDPSEFGAIGHMGFFRKNATPLWDRTLSWFVARAADPHPRSKSDAPEMQRTPPDQPGERNETQSAS